MADDDYNRSYDAGRTGNSLSGGGDYAAYLAGQNARSQAEWNTPTYGGGGGGVARPMDLKGKAVRVGLVCGLIGLPVGAFRDPSVLGAVLGFAGGMAIGVAMRLAIALVFWPFKHLAHGLSFLPAVLLGGVVGTLVGGLALGVAGAVILFVLWLIRSRRAA